MSKRIKSFPWLAVLAALVVGAAAGLAVYRSKSQAQAVAAAASATAATTNLATMEVAHALMVTVDLDFGPKLPSIADALKEIERRSEPEDGRGRTFAVLDAYGEPTADGKKLHISMHVSSEKPGKGALIFKRTGEVLWQSKIVRSTTKTNTFTGKDLLILIDNGQGKVVTVDGSNNPATILDAKIKEIGIPVRDFWPDGTEKEMTFIYSACGCPVKVMTRRVGDRTERTSDTPVMFPDDPAAVALISKLMAWN
ncbi:MAG TPA: hypothetical protein VK850_15485 [Candidatus Binatia bacterium]|nr:hypothetical protein [Candidatus Binatia bacterium]